MVNPSYFSPVEEKSQVLLQLWLSEMTPGLFMGTG